MMKTLITTFTLVSFLVTSCFLPTIGYAQTPPPNSAEKIATLKKGEPAPFNGTLFNVPAAARILTDLEFTQEACDLEITRRLRLQESEFKLKLDLKQAELDSLNFKYKETITLRDSQIEFLTENYKPRAWYESNEFWLAIGVIAGIGITVGAGYAIGQAN